MGKSISIKNLQNAGLLGAEYTELDLCDAFLMYWLLYNKSDKERIVLRNGNHTLDIDGYFRLFSRIEIEA